MRAAAPVASQNQAERPRPWLSCLRTHQGKQPSVNLSPPSRAFAAGSETPNSRGLPLQGGASLGFGLSSFHVVRSKAQRTTGALPASEATLPCVGERVVQMRLPQTGLGIDPAAEYALPAPSAHPVRHRASCHKTNHTQSVQERFDHCSVSCTCCTRRWGTTDEDSPKPKWLTIIDRLISLAM